MSNTQYSRKIQFRVDEREQHVLARSVMRSIEALGEHLAAARTFYDDDATRREAMKSHEAELRTLRSLLELLTR